MVAKRPLEPLGEWLRRLLLLTAAAGGATVMIWSARPDLVDAAEVELKQNYLARYQNALKTAGAELDDDRLDHGIERLTKLLHGLRHVKKRDRLAPLKRTAFDRILRAYQQRGESQEAALATYDELLAFDGRDLQARLERALLMMAMPGRGRQGEDALEELYRQAPTVPTVAVELVELACRRGDLTAAVRAAHDAHLTSLTRAHFEDWHLYWDTGKRFNRNQSWGGRVARDGTGGIRVAAVVEESASLLGFRIDPPSGIHIVLEHPTFTFKTRDAERRITAGDVRFRGRRFDEQRPGVFAARAGNPRSPLFLHFRLPEPLPPGDRLEVFFDARLEPLISSAMIALLRDPALVSATESDLQGFPDALRFLRQIVAAAARPSGFGSARS